MPPYGTEVAASLWTGGILGISSGLVPDAAAQLLVSDLPACCLQLWQPGHATIRVGKRAPKVPVPPRKIPVLQSGEISWGTDEGLGDGLDLPCFLGPEPG
jgi:hypothetical protein